MAGNLKGLTIELGGDTTKLDKAIESVNKRSRDLSKELGQINKLLKMDPGNADLLAQKQAVLAEAVANTSQKLDTLREAERQVQAQFERGEVSADQVRALQREIVETTNKLGQYENAARETAEAIDRLGREGDDGIRKTGDAADDAAADLRDLEDAARDAGESLDVAGVAAGTFLGNLATQALESVAGFLGECADAAIEYREAMGKLDVGFTTNGFSAQQAADAYKEVVGILGESDQAVEASNHLAQLTNSEKELATWTGDILPGVFAVFNDSLPVEGLTEAANETAKVGQVTGPLADAINWVSASTEDWSKALSGNADAQAAFEQAVSEGANAEDAFNAALAACNTEQERSSLITQAMSSLYGEASQQYKELNGDVIAANQATDSWNAAMAAAGTAVLPIISAVKEFGAELLNAAVPALEALTQNLPIVGVALGGLTAAFVAFKISAMGGLAAAIAPVMAGLKGLFALMLANPIGLVIAAITALVAGFMYLWKNCEGFREFWLNLWEKIKTAALNAADNLKQLPTKIYNSIKDAVNRVKKWGDDLVNRAKTAATNFLNNVVNTLKNIPTNVYNSISGAIQRVTSWGSDMVSKAKTAASNFLSGVASTLANIPSKVTSSISGALSAVTSWGSNMVSKAKTAMSNLVSGVTSTLSGLPGQFTTMGRNIIQGLINGISGMVGSLYSSIKNALSGLVSKAKNALGINSPSRVFADEVGAGIPEGIAMGIEDHMDDPVKAVQQVNSGMLRAAGGEVGGIQLERRLTQTAAASAPASILGSGVADKLDRILAAIEKGQILTIDGNALVGATAGRYDQTLGQRRALAARGAL